MNVIETGILQFSSTDRYRFWKSESFSLDDLLAYLDGSVIIRERFDAMVPGGRQYTLGSKAALVFPSFGVDVEDLRERMVRQYVRVEPDQAPPATTAIIDGELLPS